MRALFLVLATVMTYGGTIEGSLVNSDNHPIHDATIAITELRRSVTVDRAGFFRFEALPEGTYTLIASSDEFGSKLFRAHVGADETKELRLEIDISVHEELVVTATPNQKSISDIAQAVGVLNQENLVEKMASTLGETLADEPGVSSTYGGPGAGRPVIRGLGGDRVAVLEGGMASGDVSSVSGDHAVAIDPMTAQRIEILRGPASLRYGSSAVGGAINVVDNRIPELLSTEKLIGTVELRGGTVDEARAFGADLNGNKGKIAWHVDFSAKDTGDTRIPGPAERDSDHDEHDEHDGHDEHDEHDGHEDEGDHDEHEEEEGVLVNSDLENRKGALGLSYINDRGYVGLAVSAFDTEYGVPGHGHHEEEKALHLRLDDDEHEADDHHEEEEAVRIDMAQRRLDMRGDFRLQNKHFSKINFRLGRSDYEHRELEGAAVGTLFTNEQLDFRTELQHNQLGWFHSGSVGIHYSDRDFSARGEEAFVPPNQTEKLAAFVYEELERDNWSLVWGGRLERQTSEAEQAAAHDHHEKNEDDGAPSRSFSTFSTSLGWVVGGKGDYGFAANITRTQRAPNPEELFSNGPHLASGSFELGNIDLDKETSLGLDLSLRKSAGLVTAELNLFSNRFDAFIYQRATGELVDGLTEQVFSQEDADFYGGEFHADITLIHREPDHLHLEFGYDTVRAELSEGGYLPRITPNRFSVGLFYQRPHFHGSMELRRTEKQTRTAPGETPTDGFTFLNASVGYHFFTGKFVHKLLLRGTNLTDEEARQHTSFIKDRTLLPGRNLVLTWRLSF